MSGLTRRTLLKGLAVGVATAATTAGALTVTGTSSYAQDGIERFDEVYRGRRINGIGESAAGPRVLIDGDDLHLMVNVDGTYSTAMNHYQRFGTLREAARAAVDELAGAELTPMPHHNHG